MIKEYVHCSSNGHNLSVVKAMYVHCSSNGHNLSIVKAMSVPQARDMMGTGDTGQRHRGNAPSDDI